MKKRNYGLMGCLAMLIYFPIGVLAELTKSRMGRRRR